VQLPADHQGEEHDFYDKPGRATAVFWDVAGSLKEKEFALNLISLPRFKQRALTAEFDNLPEPRLQDDGPQRVMLEAAGR
jgi:hypothetical protein